MPKNEISEEREFELGEKDAAFVLRGDGSKQVILPRGLTEDAEAPDALIKASVLAWIISKPDLLEELQARFEKEILVSEGDIQ